MDYRKVVLGIGNPGPEYEDTRHNAGFVVLDRVAARSGLTFRRLERRGPDGARSFSGKVKAVVALQEGGRGLGPDPVLLVKPLTYVNLSGDVAGPLLRAAGLTPESLFVVVDDLNLPLGRIRIRPSGSSGGHNGLKSIEQAMTALCGEIRAGGQIRAGGGDSATRPLDPAAYPRLRLGIGQPADCDPRHSALAGDRDTVDFVLARFLPKEREVLRSVVERCADVVTEWCVGSSIETLMERHNGFVASATGPAGAPGDRES
ncbi:MAG: aminoacyl-tRNA hydrolase [Planctomycetota bacterium]